MGWKPEEKQIRRIKNKILFMEEILASQSLGKRRKCKKMIRVAEDIEARLRALRFGLTRKRP